MAVPVRVPLGLRELAPVSISFPLLGPTGLADGLALKGQRYHAAMRGFAPDVRLGRTPWFPRSAGVGYAYGFGKTATARQCSEGMHGMLHPAPGLVTPVTSPRGRTSRLA